MLGVLLGRLVGMMRGMQAMGMRDMGVMAGRIEPAFAQLLPETP